MPVRRRRPILNTTIDPVLLARLRARAERTGIPIARLIDSAVRRLLGTVAKGARRAAA